MRVVFIGPPGAGKGTQAQRLVEYLRVPHLSTGEMLRRAQQEGTSIGTAAGRLMDQGHLVDDQVVIEIVRTRLHEQDCEAGCLFDGFPRTLHQASALDQLLENDFEESLDLALELQVGREELLSRMSQRAVSEQRGDDHPQAVVQRLEIYRRESRPILKYYEDQGKLERVDGTGSPEEVFARIQQAVAAAECGEGPADASDRRATASPPGESPCQEE